MHASGFSGVETTYLRVRGRGVKTHCGGEVLNKWGQDFVTFVFGLHGYEKANVIVYVCIIQYLHYIYCSLGESISQLKLEELCNYYV